MFLNLHTSPKNPRHFVSLCFLRIKDEPTLKENNKLLKKVFEKNNVAIFHCAYGYFAANKNQQVSSCFYESLNDIKIKMGFKKEKSLDLPSDLLKNWTW
jgi:hypothetical protein